MSIALVTKPAVEPITLSDLKLQVGLSPNEDSDHVKESMTARLLRRYIKSARAECEKRTRRVFITQTWRLQLDGWPRIYREYGGFRYPVLVLPKPPYQSIVSFNYIDTSGTSQDMAVYTYQTDAGSETQPGKLYPPYAQPWPPLRLIPNNVTVEFVCGYGDDGDSVPAEIQQAILFLAHSYYDPTAFKDVDKLVDNLLDGYVNRIA